MKLDWMGENRVFLEALIHYCNIYSVSYKPEIFEYKGVTYSFALIQVVEYLLENEERGEKMAEIASRLGITRSNFTKIVNRLESKGLVEKTAVPGNRKELHVVVTDLGRELYEHYSQRIYAYHFSKMFNALNKIPMEYRELVSTALTDAVSNACFLDSAEKAEKET